MQWYRDRMLSRTEHHDVVVVVLGAVRGLHSAGTVRAADPWACGRTVQTARM